MSASDVRDLQDHSNSDVVCETLEKALWKKVCRTLQKSVDDTVCASLKHEIHEVVAYSGVQSGSLDGAEHTTSTLPSDVCTSLERITGNAVCASLKQVFADTVCKVLADTISTSMHNVVQRQHEVPFHVTPEAHNISREEIIGNALCGALKQVIGDTVCKELNKAIDKSFGVVFGTHAGQAPPSEDVRVGASIAEAGQLNLDGYKELNLDGYKELNLDGYKELNLDGDQVRHTPKPDANAKLCAYIEKRVKKEVCSQLQQVAASILCRKLKKAIREEIRQHAEQCEECGGAERFVERTASRALLTKKMGMMVVAFIAVAAVAIAAAAPGTPLHLWPTASATTLTLVPSRTGIDGTNSSLQFSGVLARDGSGVAGQNISLQRQSGDAWNTLGSAATRSDGSFSFELRRERSFTTLHQANGDQKITRETSNSPLIASRNLNSTNAETAQNYLYSSEYLFSQSSQAASLGVNISVTPSQPIKGDWIDLQAIVTGQNGDLTYGWDIKDPSHNTVNPYVDGAGCSFIAEQSGSYAITVAVFDEKEHSGSGSTTLIIAPFTANIQLSPPPYTMNNTIALDGSKSSGADQYAWSIISAPSGSSAGLTSSTAASTSFTPDKLGNYSIALKITNNGIESDTTTNVTLTVGSGSQTTTVISPTPSDRPREGQANTTIVIPFDSSSPNVHYYRVVFLGSTKCAACTSAVITINDNSSTLSAIGETNTINARVTTRLLFA